MREFLRSVLKWKLKVLAKLTLRRYRPQIVGVTGSVGKTSTKRAIATVLDMKYRVRASRGNFNNEFGLPLTILGDYRRSGGLFFWVRVLWIGAYRLITKYKYPDVLVLEYGIDKPGDMKYLLSIARPHVGVFTAVGDIPVHIEFFEGAEGIAREKGKLVESLSAGGFAVLNSDDETVAKFSNRTRARVITYGFGKGADVRITGFRTQIRKNNERGQAERPAGIDFKLEYVGNTIPVEIPDVFGKAQAYAAAAAACVGVFFEENLVAISEALITYRPAPGRMRIISGVKNSLILNDCYNASPLSMHEALHVLHDLPSKRKVAVLGDMLELGTYIEDAHAIVGRLAAKCADVLFTIGPRAKFIAGAARKAGLPRGRVQSFDEAGEAIEPLVQILTKGDLVLVKASRAMRLERVVEGIKERV